jgi:hypothetical protein
MADMKAISPILASGSSIVNIKFAKHEVKEYGSDVQIEEVARYSDPFPARDDARFRSPVAPVSAKRFEV